MARPGLRNLGYDKQEGFEVNTSLSSKQSTGLQFSPKSVAMALGKQPLQSPLDVML